MKPSHKSDHDEAIEALAAAWLAERDGGLSAVDEAEFARWVQADPRHAAAVKRLEAAWGALQQLRDYRPEAKVHPDRDLLARPSRSGRVVAFPWPALASLAAVVALAFAAYEFWPRSPVRGQEPDPATTYVTTVDGYQRVTLSDGSILELNADSGAQVNYTAAERRVRLTKGEGHFTVAKNQHRPFVVEAGRISVQAVGTAFNVRFEPRDIEVLVAEGMVKVGRPTDRQIAANVALPAVSAGQRLVVPTTGKGPVALEQIQAEAVTPEAMREALAWQGPRLHFLETPLADVIKQFNQRNRVQIELDDDALAALPVDGSFRAENVEAFLRLLESNGSIIVERLSDNRVILRSAP